MTEALTADEPGDASICRAPDCAATKLCNAHVIPRGFARVLSKPGGHNRTVTANGSRPAKQPLGPFDSKILCADCDGKLGRYDDYAIGFCKALPMTNTATTGSIFRHDAFDGNLFALAILAIFWRASISKRAEWGHISLGPHEERAGQTLFATRDLSSFPEFEVTLLRYASSNHDARRFIFPPLSIRSGGVNAYSLGVGGFLVITKFDQRPFDPALGDFVINRATSLKAPHLRFEESAEYAHFREAGAAERRRRGGPRSRS